MASKRIEDVINDVLEGDSKKNALNFANYLRANEIPLDESDCYWEVKLNGKCMCFILIIDSDDAPGPWTVWSDQEPGTWSTWSDKDEIKEYEDSTVDKHIKEIAWSHVNFCTNCGSGCNPGRSKTILGKNFDNVCKSTMAFTDPDAEALECLKKMLDIRKRDILNSA